MMRSTYLLIFFLFFSLYPALLHSAENVTKSSNPKCPAFYCTDKLGVISFPFNNKSNPECGLFTIDNCQHGESPIIQLEKDDNRWYVLDMISQAGFIHINDTKLQKRIDENDCYVLDALALPQAAALSSVYTSNLTLFKCNQTDISKPSFPVEWNSTRCNNGYEFYYSLLYNTPLPSPPENCSIIHVPVRENSNSHDLFGKLTAEFNLGLHVLYDCFLCNSRGGGCKLDAQGKFYCAISEVEEASNHFKLTLELGIGIGLPTILLLCCFYVLRYYRRRHAGSASESDFEGGSACYGVPLFSYTELEQTTQNFDNSRKLGQGGFAAVYYGKLRDGREVAVKRLFQRRRWIEKQFINEIQILTRLRHQNLVCLYGCTSRRSHELLLVYEFIPNGTIADHLHGKFAFLTALTWPIRMNIAIQTASALSYLHASYIIHRDVKTNNILLDNNFCVKVADFGISRFFPDDVTHVSTCPQGTPGYVDPEYHQYFKLTNKSDVYSFGVVLIELISSMRAVDIDRPCFEMNLGNMALSKIKKGKFCELVDSGLGFESDSETRRMMIGVARLAFRCLQKKSDRRPTMEEVLLALKKIESGNEELHNDYEEVVRNSPEEIEFGLLQYTGHPASPISGR